MPTNSLNMRTLAVDLISSILEVGAGDSFYSPTSGTIVLIDLKDNREMICGNWIDEEQVFAIEKVLDWEVVDDDTDETYYIASESEMIAGYEQPVRAAEALLEMAEKDHFEPRVRWSIFIGDE